MRVILWYSTYTYLSAMYISSDDSHAELIATGAD